MVQYIALNIKILFPKLVGMADIIHSIHPRTLNTYHLIISYNIMLAENNVQIMHQTTSDHITM
jgi:hypothetical protein